MKDAQKILEQARREKQYIESLERELDNPMLSLEKAREIKQKIDVANIYHIREAGGMVL